jgi:hypothetical protein
LVSDGSGARKIVQAPFIEVDVGRCRRAFGVRGSGARDEGSRGGDPAIAHDGESDLTPSYKFTPLAAAAEKAVRDTVDVLGVVKSSTAGRRRRRRRAEKAKFENVNASTRKSLCGDA